MFDTERRLRYHFVGIGGIGMSALAQITKSQGHFVGGSDRKWRRRRRSRRTRGCPHDKSCGTVAPRKRARTLPRKRKWSSIRPWRCSSDMVVCRNIWPERSPVMVLYTCSIISVMATRVSTEPPGMHTENTEHLSAQENLRRRGQRSERALTRVEREH